MTTDDHLSTNVYTPSERPGPIQRVRQVIQYRELLVNLTRKELTVRYKNSVLGFMWSLLNPLLYLVVFSLVFQEILRADVPLFAVFLLSGLVAWNLFSAGLGAATGSIVTNAPLVQKVWFPREILPLAAIGAALVHFFLQLLVLFAALLVFQHSPEWTYFPVLVLALAVLLVFVTALGIALSAVNVYARDTQHLLELVLLAWFWLTAIVYPIRLITDRLGDAAWAALLNPMIPIVVTFQRVIYNPERTDLLPEADVWWYVRNLSVLGVVSLAALFGALVLFGRLEDDLGEEI
ncbi:MAG: ABC transporter permease [Acidimicrobiales bacterium]